MSEWLNCVHLITGRGTRVDKRRIYQDDRDLVFVTIIQFIGVIPKPVTPLYYDFFSQEEKKFVKKKKGKRRKYRKSSYIYTAVLTDTPRKYSCHEMTRKSC